MVACAIYVVRELSIVDEHDVRCFASFVIIIGEDCELGGLDVPWQG